MHCLSWSNNFFLNSIRDKGSVLLYVFLEHEENDHANANNTGIYVKDVE